MIFWNKCIEIKFKIELKKPMKDIKIFLNKKKKKSNNMVVNITKISQKMKNKSLLSIGKNVLSL